MSSTVSVQQYMRDLIYGMIHFHGQEPNHYGIISPYSQLTLVFGIPQVYQGYGAFLVLPYQLKFHQQSPGL